MWRANRSTRPHPHPCAVLQDRPPTQPPRTWSVWVAGPVQPPSPSEPQRHPLLQCSGLLQCSRLHCWRVWAQLAGWAGTGSRWKPDRKLHRPLERNLHQSGHSSRKLLPHCARRAPTLTTLARGSCRWLQVFPFFCQNVNGHFVFFWSQDMNCHFVVSQAKRMRPGDP